MDLRTLTHSRSAAEIVRKSVAELSIRLSQIINEYEESSGIEISTISLDRVDISTHGSAKSTAVVRCEVIVKGDR